MAAEVIEGNACINIVRRVDVDLYIKYMLRRIGCIHVVNEGPGNSPLAEVVKIYLVNAIFRHIFLWYM